MTTDEKQQLLQRYLSGNCTTEEALLVESWMEELCAEDQWTIPHAEKEATHDRLLSKIKLGTDARASSRRGGVIRRLLRNRYVDVAAAVLIVCAAVLYVMSLKHNEGGAASEVTLANDVPPGGNRAVLVLAGGKRITLDSAANGLLAVQGKGRVVKKDGELDYSQGDEPNAFNTLATPRGGQYQLVLPDGSRVWLDAASSITYPTSFKGKTRQVSITGQAFFQVVHNAQQPFEVSVRGQLVRDVGTSFNINAYEDEPTIQVTLDSGAISVGLPGKEFILQHSGQQVEFQDGKVSPVMDADLTGVLAWKNGLFHFSGADIGTIMRQVSRWYDIDVVFSNGMPSGHITGEVPRNTNLSTVLRVLQTSGVHFTVEGNKMLVTP